MSQYPDPKTFQPPPRSSMDFGQAINYVFNNPNWFVNILLPALCLLPAICLGIIPILGPILQQLMLAIAVGYGWEASATLLATNGTRYPDFDFSHIGTYLTRAMGWLVCAIISNVIGLALQFGFVGFGAMGGPGAQPNDAQIFAFLAAFGVVGLTIFVLMFFMYPMMFRAGLTGSVGDTFDFGWGWDFFSRMWLEMIVCSLVMLAVGFVAGLIGFLLLCVGIFLVGPFMQLVRGHLDYQLYELYLARGGIPVTGMSPASLQGYAADPNNPFSAPAGSYASPLGSANPYGGPTNPYTGGPANPYGGPPMPGNNPPPPSWPPPPPK